MYFGDLSQVQGKKMVQVESLYILKDQERVKWGNKWVKTNGPSGKARRDITSLEDEKWPL